MRLDPAWDVPPAADAGAWLGWVVAITSTGVRQPIHELVYSNAGRSALWAWLKTTGRAVAADGVTINAVMPGRFGFVVGGQLPAAAAADWLTTAWGQNAALHALSPAAAVAEEVAGAWMLDLLGLPADASFGFPTGAGLGNAVGLAAGRHAVLARRAGTSRPTACTALRRSPWSSARRPTRPCSPHSSTWAWGATA